MLDKHLSGLILKELGYPPTNDQSIIIEKLGGFIVSERNDQVLLIRGYAGTRKTTVIAAVVNVLKMNQQVVLLRLQDVQLKFWHNIQTQQPLQFTKKYIVKKVARIIMSVSS